MATKEIIQIIGTYGDDSVSKKTNNPYTFGEIYTLTPLAPPIGSNMISKGYMGDSLKVPYDLVRSISHLPTPFNAEITKDTFMRFGKRQEMITAIVPLEKK